MTPPAPPTAAGQDSSRLAIFVRTGRTPSRSPRRPRCTGVVSVVAVASMAAVFSSTSGCGYFGYEPAVSQASAGPDAGPDAGTDASPDASTDAGREAGTDAGQTHSPIVCADVPSALVCTDFDDLAGFTSFANDGLAEPTQGLLDTMTTAPGGYASVVATFDPVFDGTLYFRGRMRIVGTYPIVDVNPFMIGNRVDLDYGVDFNLVNAGELRINPSSGPGANAAAPLARDTWICLDGAIVLGDVHGSAFVRADGVTVVSLSDADTLPPSGVANLSVGIDWTSGLQSNARVQWDDFVLARAPVVCP